MSIYSDFINDIKPISYDKYASVSSREKLVVYAIKYLKNNMIPTGWNNIAIAAFKLFPEKFYFSEEFKEYPHIEMLNRTLLHLRPKERNYATGGTRVKYELTKLGEEIARQVEAEISLTTKRQPVMATKRMDEHKVESDIEYFKLKESSVYKKFIEGNYDEMDAWSYYGVTPFTQIIKLKNNIKEIRSIAEEKGDKEILALLDKLGETIT